MEPEKNPYSAPDLVAEDERPFAELRRRIQREILGVTIVFMFIGVICVLGLLL